MHELRGFVQSTAIYLVGNVLSKALQFFILPLYTAYLDPEVYGTYDLHVAYITFLSSVLFFDIWGGILRFSYDYKVDRDKAKAVTCGMTIFSLSTISYSILVFGLGSILKISYIEWLYLYGLTMNLSQVVGYVARAFGKNYMYALGGLIGTIVNLVCNVMFIAVFQWGYEYIYISYCLGMIINIIIAGRSCHFLSLLKCVYFEKKLFREMLMFSAPLSLNSTAFWFLTSYNKVVVNQYMNAAQNGMYAVAMKFSAMLQLVTQCFQMAWQELTFSKAGKSREEMDAFYTKAVNEYIKFMGLGMVGLIPLLKIVFPFFIDASYSAAEGLVPVAMLGTLFSCISSFLASIISTIKKNKFLFTTTAMGSVVNIVLIHILISSLGTYAAVISFAVGFLIVDIRRCILLNKYLKININRKNLVALSIGFVMVYLIYIKCSYGLNCLALIFTLGIIMICYRDIVIKLYRKVGRKCKDL